MHYDRRPRPLFFGDRSRETILFQGVLAPFLCCCGAFSSHPSPVDSRYFSQIASRGHTSLDRIRTTISPSALSWITFPSLFGLDSSSAITFLHLFANTTSAWAAGGIRAGIIHSSERAKSDRGGCWIGLWKRSKTLRASRFRRQLVVLLPLCKAVYVYRICYTLSWLCTGIYSVPSELL